jgi:hypothetical protein
VDEASCT